MLYVQLDTNWPDHPKIIEAGIDGAGLHAVCLALHAKRRRGGVTVAELQARGASIDLIHRLLDLDLLREASPGVVVPTTDAGARLRTWRRPWIPTAIRRAVMERDGYRCVTCGAVGPLTLDHIVPFSHNGPDTEENLQAMCQPCNSRKGNRV